ncbi:hypothetical protein FRC12_012154 [Ceratobasidium sp. 428]|nr:hypothetical protein FRC12_012154 [Ceratobasidium sp. 428]
MLGSHNGLLTSSSSSTFSSPEDTQPIVTSALSQWKSSRSLLSSTIRAYLAACVTLRTSYVTHGRQSVEQSMVQETLVAIDSELESLASEEEMLCDMRISLAAIRNNSATFARINILPPEVLVKIFRLLKVGCAYDNDLELTGFAGVCTYWRGITLGTADLWTHIDVGPGVPQTITQYLLSLSTSNPIHIHTTEPPSEEGNEDDPCEHTCTHEAEAISTTLGPHLLRVCTLEIISSSVCGKFVSSVLDLWFSRGSFGRLKSLLVDRPEVRDPMWIPSSWEGILALNSLRLADAMFDWTSNAYVGLVDLQLDFWYHGTFISMPQLANILSASPALATLNLGYITINQVESWFQLSPIVMGCLKVLNLAKMHPDDTILLLSLITVPLRAELSIKHWAGTIIDNRLLEFFARSKITTFYCHGGYIAESWKHLFWSSLRFHTMILSGFPLETTSFVQPTAVSPSPVLPPPSCVTLLGCIVTFESLKCLIIGSGTRHLQLEQCATPTTLDLCQKITTIRESLLELYPDLCCSISDIDSTEDLSCRTLLFDRPLW